jgi:hypothetical protein
MRCPSATGAGMIFFPGGQSGYSLAELYLSHSRIVLRIALELRVSVLKRRRRHMYKLLVGGGA